MPYQLIELNTPATENLLCPHCKHAVINWAEEQYIQPCEHTLFVAMDLGFEFVADVFEQSMLRSVDDIHAHDDQLDMWLELTSSQYPQYLIYKTDLGVQDLSRYIGFTAA